MTFLIFLFFSSLPELLEKKRLVDLHMNIATAMLEHIKVGVIILLILLIDFGKFDISVSDPQEAETIFGKC